MGNVQPLTINNWQQGVADSPYLGFGKMKNVDIESKPGAVKVQKVPASMFYSTTTRTFTSTAGATSTEGFETYNTGDLNGQYNWSGDTDWDIQSTTVYAGTKAVQCGAVGAAKTISKSFALGASGSQVFYGRVASLQNGEAFEVDFYNGATVAFGCGFLGGASNGNLRIAGNTIQAYTDGNWYKIEVEWNCTTDLCRARVDDGAWTDWFAFANPTTTIDKITFYNNSNAGNGYLDDFLNLSISYTLTASDSLGSFDYTRLAVQLTTTGTLPAGLSTGTNYFLIKVSSTEFQLATTIANANAGTAITVTDAGTGVHTITAVPCGTIYHIVRNPDNDNYFLHDSNGRVWYTEEGPISTPQMFLLSGNTLTNPSGKGLVVFKNSNATAVYLFAFRDAKIDVIPITAITNLRTPVWSNDWQSLNSAAASLNSHHTIVAQDNIIYFCDGRYVGSIVEKAAQVFDPATAATYTYNSQALDMPNGEINNWLTELGVSLLIAGNSYNKIYPWDRVSDSYTLPINIPEFSVKKMINIGNIIYVLAGTKGNIYTTNGSYVSHFKKIPDYLINNTGTLAATIVTWGGIASRNGALLVGLAGYSNEGSGVYLLYPDGRFVQDNTPSTGTINPTAIYAENEFYIMGYAGGADYLTTSYFNITGTIQSAFYQVGNKTQKASFSELEAQIGKLSGNIVISYRTNLTADWTTIASFTVSSDYSYNADVGTYLTDLENLQIQAQLTGPISAPSTELMSIKLTP